MKKTLITIGILTVAVCAIAITGGSFYMLDYSLAPDGQRRDTAYHYARLVEKHPEVKPWLDSLKAEGALRDTFVTMPSGERHHGYFVSRDSSRKVAVLIHGWRDNAIKFFYIARMYHQLLGYNVLMPDLHAHGLSEGEAAGMGWKERFDVLHWMEVAAERFRARDFVVHGVSMGAATTMNVSGEKMPACVERVRFIEDCGYTSVWDEFSYQVKAQFGLPDFPLMYTTSLLCQLKYGWSFQEASPLRQVAKCPYPMLFIHGDSDTFVPSEMVERLYDAKAQEKQLWVTEGVEHALSCSQYPEAYLQHISQFIAE